MVGLEADMAQFMLLTPLPVTPLYRDMKQEGLLRDDLPWEEWHGQKELSWKHPAFPGDAPARWLEKAFRADHEANSSTMYRVVETAFRGWKRLAALPRRDACLEHRMARLAKRTLDWMPPLAVLSRNGVNALERERAARLEREIADALGVSALRRRALGAAVRALAAAWRLRLRLFGDGIQPATIVTRYPAHGRRALGVPIAPARLSAAASEPASLRDRGTRGSRGGGGGGRSHGVVLVPPAAGENTGSMSRRRDSHPGLRRSSLGLRGAIVTLSAGVLVPVILSTAVGIVALVIGTSTKEMLIGILVVCFTAAAAGGAVVAVVLLGRRARLARLQSDLLANVSHELRTPLAAIRMYAQTLESGLLEKDPESTRQSLATIVRETEWLEATVERVLTWRSLARDQDAVDLRPGPVGGAVEDALARFRRMVVPGEVELDVEIASERPVSHDRDALGRVVLNLLANAYKYTGEKKRIRVAVRDGGDGVEITVEDNGIGIPAADLEHVFEPFFRVDSGSPGGAAGAGLGLAIVRQVVRLHGGEVTASSEPGRGSIFTVRLPVAAAGSEA